MIAMTRRNLLFEWLCGGLQFAFYFQIAAAVIIVAFNIFYAVRMQEQDTVEKTTTYTVQAETETKTLYIEETRFSGADIYFAEMEQEQPQDTGYLITDEMRMVAQLVQAEAGNQDLTGKRLVADVVLNRVDSERFPNTVEEVIFQRNPVQFGVIVDGAFDRVGGDVSEECFKAVQMEWEKETRLDKNVMYFNGVHENGKNPFKHGDHWFSY